MQCHTSFTGWLINVGHKRIIDLYQPCYKCKLSYSSMFYVLYWTVTKKSFPISVIYVGGLHHYYLDSFDINNVLQYHTHALQSRFQLYLWFKQVEDPIALIDYVIECVWPRSVDKYLVPGQFVICVESVNSNTQVHSQYSKGQGMSVHL